jgi:prepilin-type N-terminal cleavage/methylation domain-containing protein
MKTKAHNAFTLIEIMIVVAIIGILAAIVIPGFKQSLEKSQRRACALTRRNIDGMKVQWAAENKLPATAVPNENDLFGQNGYADHKPDCPAGGAYALNAVAEKCTCNAPRHENEP